MQFREWNGLCHVYNSLLYLRFSAGHIQLRQCSSVVHTVWDNSQPTHYNFLQTCVLKIEPRAAVVGHLQQTAVLSVATEAHHAAYDLCLFKG